MSKRSPKKAPTSTQKAAESQSDTKDDSTKIAFQKIKQMMYRNELSPGQKIRYKDLAKKFEMSPTPIVNALGRLSELRLVTYELNRGYVVKSINEKELRELFDAREALEVHLLPEVIKNATPEALRAINDHFKEQVDIRNSYHRRLVIMRDLGLHLKLVEIAQNDVFKNLLKEIFECIYLGYKPEYLLDRRIGIAVREHRAILDAIEKKDVDSAVENTREHIKSSLSYMLKGILQREDAMTNKYENISSIEELQYL